MTTLAQARCRYDSDKYPSSFNIPPERALKRWIWDAVICDFQSSAVPLRKKDLRYRKHFVQGRGIHDMQGILLAVKTEARLRRVGDDLESEGDKMPTHQASPLQLTSE